MGNAHFVFSELGYWVRPNGLPMAYVNILFYYFYKKRINFFCKRIINLFFLKERIKEFNT